MERRAFTLIEIVVYITIITVLASIAIPIYKRYILMAKTSEAKQNIGAIMTCEYSFAATENKFLTERYYPGNANKNLQTWNPKDSGNFEVLGFQPSGKVYYDYGIADGDFSANPSEANPEHGEAPVTNGVDITVIARGDLDGDGVYSYMLTTDTFFPKIRHKGSNF